MRVTATEFKTHIGKYLSLASKEEIVITRNGKRIAKLMKTTDDKTDIVKSLIGVLPKDASLEKSREERLNKHESHD